MARNPELIGGILSELMARRGLARVQSARAYEAAWREAAGELAARYTRVGQLRRGILEVIVLNSTLVQELTFQKPALLSALAELLPDEGLQDLRFRVGPVGP
jgi:predicted nucleic acid-binding Zn ribbon protein